MGIYKTGIWETGEIKSSLLPSNYQAVEYISKSETTQRACMIDTGLYPAAPIRYEMDITWDAPALSGSSFFAAGYYSTATSGSLYYSPLTVASSSNKLGMGYNGVWHTCNTVWNPGDRHTIISILKNGQQTLEMDGAVIYSDTASFTPPTVDITIPLFVYQYQTNRLEGYGWSGKIYSIKIYGEQGMLRNYIPCIRKEDNVVGLYDSVQNQFYTTTSTVQFTGGEEIPAPDITQARIFDDKLEAVEFIEI